MFTLLLAAACGADRVHPFPPDTTERDRIRSLPAVSVEVSQIAMQSMGCAEVLGVEPEGRDHPARGDPHKPAGNAANCPDAEKLSGTATDPIRLSHVADTDGICSACAGRSECVC